MAAIRNSIKGAILRAIIHNIYTSGIELSSLRGPSLAIEKSMKQILVGFAIMSLIACAPSGHDSASKGVGMPSNFSTWSTVDADRSARRSSHSNFGVSQPPIFKISFRNGSASYLFGTVHMGISLKELPQWLLDLHDKTKVHAYEMNKLKEIRALRNNRGNADFGTLEAYSAGGKPLTKKNVFSEAEIAQLAKLGIPEAVARSIGDNNCSIVATRKQLFAHDRYDSIDGDLEERTAAAEGFCGPGHSGLNQPFFKIFERVARSAPFDPAILQSEIRRLR